VDIAARRESIVMFAVAAIVAVVDADWQARNQFYSDVHAGRYDAAVAEGQAYALRHPSDDRFALDLAYAEIRAVKRNDALTLLRRLSHSSDSSVATAAQQQLAAIGSFLPSGTPGGYLYVYSQDESRFGDVFNGVALRYDFSEAAIRPYAALNLSYDTRSGVPGVSDVYNDNAAVASVGFRAPIGLGQYGYAYVLGGDSIGLRGEPTFGDFRYGFAYSRDYGPLDASQPHTLTYFSAAAYSRYAGDAIVYAQASHDVSITPLLRAIAGTSVALDTHRQYYNNYAEAYAGVLVHLTTSVNVRFVGVAGDYLPRGIGVPRPFYSGVRVLLVSGSNVP
jgi:hypothetical protein